jgi:hypothetical protein
VDAAVIVAAADVGKSYKATREQPERWLLFFCS